MILLLLATGVLYSIWGELSDAITIFAVITLLVASEVVNEWRAERAIDALADLRQPTNRVMVAWAAAAALFVAAVVTIPALRSVFRTTTLSASSWAAVLAGGLLTTAWIELAKHRRANRAVAPVAYGGGHDGAAS